MHDAQLMLSVMAEGGELHGKLVDDKKEELVAKELGWCRGEEAVGRGLA